MVNGRAARLAVMALMTGLAAVSAVAAARPPGPGDMIAFTRCRELTGCGRGTDIWVMRPDATGLKVLTRYGTHNGSPSWSPDGRRIAFVSGRGGFDQIWTMKADGSDMRRLTAPRALDADPAWSPDGRRIAFVRKLAASRSTIYLINVRRHEPPSADGQGGRLPAPVVVSGRAPDRLLLSGRSPARALCDLRRRGGRARRAQVEPSRRGRLPSIQRGRRMAAGSRSRISYRPAARTPRTSRP